MEYTENIVAEVGDIIHCKMDSDGNCLYKVVSLNEAKLLYKEKALLSRVEKVFSKNGKRAHIGPIISKHNDNEI